MIGWIIGGRAHQKPIARKVTHPSTIPGLGGSTLDSHRINVKALGLSHCFLTWFIDTNGIKKMIIDPYHIGIKNGKILIIDIQMILDHH